MQGQYTGPVRGHCALTAARHILRAVRHPTSMVYGPQSMVHGPRSRLTMLRGAFPKPQAATFLWPRGSLCAQGASYGQASLYPVPHTCTQAASCARLVPSLCPRLEAPPSECVFVTVGSSMDCGKYGAHTIKSGHTVPGPVRGQSYGAYSSRPFPLCIYEEERKRQWRVLDSLRNAVLNLILLLECTQLLTYYIHRCM